MGPGCVPAGPHLVASLLLCRDNHGWNCLHFLRLVPHAIMGFLLLTSSASVNASLFISLSSAAAVGSMVQENHRPGSFIGSLYSAKRPKNVLSDKEKRPKRKKYHTSAW